MNQPALLALTGLLVFSSAASSQTSPPAAGYDAIRAKATAEKTDLAILAHGTTDWDKNGPSIKAGTFANATWLAALPKELLTVCVEVPDSATNQMPQSSLDELRRLGREVPGQIETTAAKGPDSTFKADLVWNFPALIYQDAGGQLIGILEGLDPQKNPPKSMTAQVTAWHQARMARDALLAKAGAATGVEKARLIGQALDALPFKGARAQSETIKALRAADPKDETGYVAKYTYHIWDFGSEMAKLATDKRYEEGLALIAKRKAQPVLTTEQKQAVEVQRYVLCRFWKGHEAEAVTALKTAMAMDPASDTAIGCKGVLKQIADDQEYKRLGDAVEAAEKTGDSAAYSKVAEEIIASPVTAPHRAKAKELAMPQFNRPAGNLLSKKGMLSFGRETKDIPILRPLVLRDNEPGLCSLYSMRKPWFQVDLLKNATLTGIVVVNRLDADKESQIPLTVSVSTDGKAWQEIYRSEKTQDCWEVKAPAGLQARYVRVGRDGPSGYYFNVSNILVYGNP